MIHTKTEAVPATTRTIETHRTCDLCGERCGGRHHYEENDVRIECRTGDAYPEGSTVVGTECDMCAACFRAKLVPWLESQGVKMREVDRGY